MIIASWCGKKVDMQNIFNRPNWDKIEAIANRHVHEIRSAYLLQPGPAVLKGLEEIHALIMKEFG
jgi:iron complex transport system substrate-binding protein